jgi:hypothetical protein
MGQLIHFPERAIATKHRRVAYAHLAQQRALAHARMMVVSALLAAGLMMSALAALPFVQ